MSEKYVLLVEDNADDEELTLIAFRQNNIANKIVVARDGAEALEYLFDTAQPLPAVVLLDLNLPKIDGLEVLRQMRENERTSHVPVVVLTSSREEQDIIASYNLHCNSYVRKPVDFTQFIQASRQLGLYWLLLNEPSPAIQSQMRGSASGNTDE
jgi:two-component system response regulator